MPFLLDGPNSESMGMPGDEHELPIPMVVQRGIDVCRGLQDLHAAGIIMRSLNPVCKASYELIFMLHSCVYFESFCRYVLLQLACSDMCPSGGPSSLYCLCLAIIACAYRMHEATKQCWAQTNVLMTGSGTAVLADFGLAQDGDNQSEYRWATQVLCPFPLCSIAAPHSGGRLH